MTGSRISLAWFAVAYTLCVALGHVIVVPLGSATIPALWPATGLLTGALILTVAPGRRLLPLISLAITLASILVRGEVTSNALFAVVATADACAVAWLVRRFVT